MIGEVLLQRRTHPSTHPTSLTYKYSDPVPTIPTKKSCPQMKLIGSCTWPPFVCGQEDGIPEPTLNISLGMYLCCCTTTTCGAYCPASLNDETLQPLMNQSTPKKRKNKEQNGRTYVQEDK